MKLALISDVHGNLEALTAVLQDIDKQKVDKIHCLGDVIGYGSDPTACLELVSKNCDIKLMGNHEYVILGLEPPDSYTHAARVSAVWTQDHLTDKELSLMADFEIDRYIDDLYLVHASPFEPDRWHYVLGPDEATAAFERLQGRLCFHGHSHIPLIFSEMPNQPLRRRVGHSFLPNSETRHLINIGSVGQPRDNDPRACYVTFDINEEGEEEVTYHRVEYDIETAQSKMAQARLPDILIDRLTVGR